MKISGLLAASFDDLELPILARAGSAPIIPSAERAGHDGLSPATAIVLLTTSFPKLRKVEFAKMRLAFGPLPKDDDDDDSDEEEGEDEGSGSDEGEEDS
ncbi:hypothetical protein LshimejAT787_0112120 [Lyophyllum shimeji]|uniref:Uncharacterized protein n=1 Tax=Lyophyllum shimeji TaxID=47721 RepID=A0A9P3UIF4_LYOSH|nr:hypothetical protein LshimejAT787_0112120 [Lyophyllum shimeji]